MVLRDRGCHGAACILQDHGQVPEPENHHAPFRRDRAHAGRPHWPAGISRARTSDEDLSVILKQLKKRPLDYFKHSFYADTAVFGGVPATHAGLAFYDPDKIVFASDCPFDPEKGTMYTRETCAFLKASTCPKRTRKRSGMATRGDHGREVQELVDKFISPFVPAKAGTQSTFRLRDCIFLDSRLRGNERICGFALCEFRRRGSGHRAIC